MKKSEYYKDILFYIEERLGLISAMEAAKEEKEPHRRDLYLYMVEQRQQAIDRWLSEEVQVEKKLVNTVNKDEIIERVKRDLNMSVNVFAKKVHELRRSHELSMAALYKLSGVSSSTINDIEKVKYVPNLDVFLKLGYALGLSKDEIFEILKGNEIKEGIIKA